jgi:hypothetical protein
VELDIKKVRQECGALEVVDWQLSQVDQTRWLESTRSFDALADCAGWRAAGQAGELVDSHARHA